MQLMLMFSGSTWLHAPPFRCAISSPPPPSRTGCSHFSMATSVRIAIVGDVHDDWSREEDTKALQLLKPDLVLFTGDFGNENVDLVKSISNLEFAKAIILGNHDAWNTQKFSAREKDAVQLQLELYGVNDMGGSAKRIYEAALQTPADHSVIFLAHNGPTGLGSNVDDICGRDWFSGGGDHGDPDLARAISQLKETTELSIKLVVFGHMHKELAYGNGLRKMIVVGDDNIIYLNGAIVPRVKIIGKEQVSYMTGSNTENPQAMSGGTLRAFTVADILEGSLEKIVETWVSVIGEKVTVEDELVLFSKGA